MAKGFFTVLVNVYYTIIYLDGLGCAILAFISAKLNPLKVGLFEL
jgi:hypothetical protein